MFNLMENKEFKYERKNGYSFGRYDESKQRNDGQAAKENANGETE